MKKAFKIIGILALAGIVVGGIFGYDIYKKAFLPNVPSELSEEYVHIPTNASFEEVTQLLIDQGFIINQSSFEWTANRMNYIKNPMRAGRFKIKPGMSNKALVGLLRSGAQSTVKLTINNKRTLPEVAGFVSKIIEADSLSLYRLLNDVQYLAEFDLNKQTAMSAMIPNTYEVYWNTSAEGFFEKMIQERRKFWSEERIAKAKALNLTKEEVYTIASIVEKESNQNPEKPDIAGVYLNRIRKGWKLEADPTVVFANNDFTIKRVLNKHKEVDSPYNTYMYEGIPPGPIAMASISSIDAVLQNKRHDYMFFCAKVDGGGYHTFAKTLNGHLVNARRYQRWLNQQGIR